VTAAPRHPAIRYFYPEDLGAAETLGGLLREMDDHWAMRAFTGYEPKPRPGTIELWIANS
jgi:hypothetical protein